MSGGESYKLLLLESVQTSEGQPTVLQNSRAGAVFTAPWPSAPSAAVCFANKLTGGPWIG